MSPLLAQSGHLAAEFRCPLSGVKRTSCDPLECPLLTLPLCDMNGARLLLCNSVPDPPLRHSVQPANCAQRLHELWRTRESWNFIVPPEEGSTRPQNLISSA